MVQFPTDEKIFPKDAQYSDFMKSLTRRPQDEN